MAVTISPGPNACSGQYEQVPGKVLANYLHFMAMSNCIQRGAQQLQSLQKCKISPSGVNRSQVKGAERNMLTATLLKPHPYLTSHITQPHSSPAPHPQPRQPPHQPQINRDSERDFSLKVTAPTSTSFNKLPWNVQPPPSAADDAHFTDHESPPASRYHCTHPGIRCYSESSVSIELNGLPIVLSLSSRTHSWTSPDRALP
jgi:hypothetical protein